MPFPYSRLIVGTRHCRVLIVGNINSDATGFDIRIAIRPGSCQGIGTSHKRFEDKWSKCDRPVEGEREGIKKTHFTPSLFANAKP